MADDDPRPEGPKGDASQFEVVLREMGKEGFEHRLAKPAALGAFIGAMLGTSLLDGGGFIIGAVCGALLTIYVKMND
ncbi:MAG: hypothetical protein AAF291_17375 [Pseudomonadota bacterium]